MAVPRIASINLCSDQYLIALADRSQITSVTALASDTVRSAEAAGAAGLPVNHGAAEEIAAQAPDMVLANSFSDPSTIALIRRIGIPVLVLPDPNNFEGIAANVRQVAGVLGVPERGEAVVAKIESEIGQADPPLIRPVIVMLEPGGYTQGPPSLIDQAITLAGGVNLARILGLTAYSSLPLERLVASSAALVIEPAESRHAASLSFAALRHPALQARFADTAHLALPANLTDCPAPASAALVPILRRALQSLPVAIQQ